MGKNRNGARTCPKAWVPPIPTAPLSSHPQSGLRGALLPSVCSHVEFRAPGPGRLAKLPLHQRDGHSCAIDWSQSLQECLPRVPRWRQTRSCQDRLHLRRPCLGLVAWKWLAAGIWVAAVWDLVASAVRDHRRSRSCHYLGNHFHGGFVFRGACRGQLKVYAWPSFPGSRPELDLEREYSSSLEREPRGQESLGAFRILPR